jgi:hypothetical protein
VQADAYMVQVSSTEPLTIMGQTQPATSDTSIIWMTKDKAYMTTNIGAAILRADLGMMYVVNSEAGTYAEFPLGAMAKESEEVTKAMKTEMGKDKSDEMAEAMEEAGDNPQAAQMMEAMKAMMGGSEGGSGMSAKVVSTDETKKIRDWNTRLWLVDMNIMMGKSTQRVWATKDIDIDYAKFQELGSAMLAVMPGFEDIVNEMKKIEGIPVLTEIETKVMGTSVKQKTEILEYQSKAAPDGIYEIDKNLKQVSLIELGMGQR